MSHAHISGHAHAHHDGGHHTHHSPMPAEKHEQEAKLGADTIRFTPQANPPAAPKHGHTHGHTHGHDHDHDHHEHAHEHAHSHALPSFIDTLTEHPTVRMLQACTGLLMIPMVPMMVYAIYTTLHAGFQRESDMPALTG
jgi:hypothetical protein